MALALCAKASVIEAAKLANYAAGLVVQERGTATVSRKDLTEAIKKES
jgi:bifunctional ADP-heptose synthase (sugar kinase/adenylyltransferase)